VIEFSFFFADDEEKEEQPRRQPAALPRKRSKKKKWWTVFGRAVLAKPTNKVDTLFITNRVVLGD
jgi:hypothetical protein